VTDITQTHVDAWGVKLTTCLHLVPRLKMHGASTSTPPVL